MKHFYLTKTPVSYVHLIQAEAKIPREQNLAGYLLRRVSSIPAQRLDPLDS